jgi:SOS-response transcriptional repressor LexA
MDISKTEQVYKFISDFLETNSYSPNITEIAQGCFINTSTVTRCLDYLEIQGHITRIPGRARTIRLLKPITDISSQDEN